MDKLFAINAVKFIINKFGAEVVVGEWGVG